MRAGTVFSALRTAPHRDDHETGYRAADQLLTVLERALPERMNARIVDTLDMFTRLPLRICGEVQIAVHHNLASKSPRSFRPTWGSPPLAILPAMPKSGN